MAVIAFCLAPLWNASSRGQQKLWPKKLFNLMHFSFHLSLTILGKTSLQNYSSRNAIKKLTPLKPLNPKP
jgi:hypothetical protein